MQQELQDRSASLRRVKKKAKIFSLKRLDLLNLSTGICLDVPIGLLSGSTRSEASDCPPQTATPAHRRARGCRSGGGGCQGRAGAHGRAEHPGVLSRSALGSSAGRQTVSYFKNDLKMPRFGEAPPARFCKSAFTCQAGSGACLDAAGFNKKIFG